MKMNEGPEMTEEMLKINYKKINQFLQDYTGERLPTKIDLE